MYASPSRTPPLPSCGKKHVYAYPSDTPDTRAIADSNLFGFNEV